MTRNKDARVTGKRGRSVEGRRRNDGFNLERKKLFLQEFAATGNVRDAAEAAGIARSTVYEHRIRDADFRAAWAQAQEHCYAALEAELVCRAREMLGATCSGGGEAIAGMDSKLAFAMLQNFQKRMGKEPGDIAPQRSDLDEATRRLESAMRRFRLLPPPPAPPASEGQE